MSELHWRVVWDTEEGDNVVLPEVVAVPKDIEDVASWISDEFGWLVSGLEKTSELPDRWYAEEARRLYGTDNGVELDSAPVVSRGDDPGAYVAAWVWVPHHEEGGDE